MFGAACAVAACGALDGRSVLPAAEEGSDQASADLLSQRMAMHEKTAWMLRSLLASAAGPGTAARANRVINS